jgi:hypothetical protein
MRGIDAMRHMLPTSEGGSALVTVLAIVTAVLLVGSALFIMGTGESDLVEYTVDSARAFCLAEAGQSYAGAWLRESAQASPARYPLTGVYEGCELGDGEYDISVTQLASPYPWIYEYDVVATGEVAGVQRSVRTRLRSETFAVFGHFVDLAADIWIATPDSMWGSVHSNDHIKIAGDPYFGGKVTTVKTQFLFWGECDPTFEQGCEFGVAEIPFPTGEEVAEVLESVAQSGGVCPGMLSGSQARYEVVLARNGALGYLSYRSFAKQGGGQSYSWSDWTDVDIASTNGVFWFDADVEMWGTLDGEATIASSKSVIIADDVLYEDSSPGFGPNPGCDDMLGIVACGGDIIIGDSQPNRDDCEIHAHMMSMSTSLYAENSGSGLPRGELIIWGGIAQSNCGIVGNVNFDDFVVDTGYSRDFHGDERFLVKSPPYYPLTGRYLVMSWEEITPPES